MIAQLKHLGFPVVKNRFLRLDIDGFEFSVYLFRHPYIALDDVFRQTKIAKFFPDGRNQVLTGDQTGHACGSRRHAGRDRSGRAKRRQRYLCEIQALARSANLKPVNQARGIGRIDQQTGCRLLTGEDVGPAEVASLLTEARDHGVARAQQPLARSRIRTVDALRGLDPAQDSPPLPKERNVSGSS